MRLLRPLLAAAKTVSSAEASFGFKTGGYRKLGLKTDDLYYDSLPVVAEAVRRLPEDVKMERVYRLKRAIHLSTIHNILPEEEWTKPEEDERYLTPLVKQVQAEFDEKKNWKGLEG